MDIPMHAETNSFGDAVDASTPYESTQSLSQRLRLLAHSQPDSLSDPQVDVPREEEQASAPRLDQSTAPSKDADRLPRSMRALLASAFIHSIGLGLVTVATPQMELSLFSDDTSHAAAVNSVINPIAGVIGFFCTLLWSSLSDMYGRKLFLLLSLLGSACGLLVVGVTYNLLGLVLSRLIPAMFDVSNSVTYAVVSDVIPPERFVRTYAVFAAALGGGLLCGPLLGLAVMQIERDRLPWLVCASLTGLNWLWLARQLPETLRWRERVEQAKSAAAAEHAAPLPPLDTALQVKALAEAGELLAHAAIAADATPLPSATCPSAEPQSPAASPLAGTAPPRSSEVREEIRPVPFERPPALRPLEFIQVAALRPFRHVSIIWSTRTLLRLNLSLLLHSMSDGFLVTVVFLYTKVQWGWGTELNSALLVYAGILSLLTMLFIQPRLTRCLGEARMMQLAQAATMLQQLVVALSPFGWSVFVICTICAINFLWTPTLRAQISRQVRPNQQGELQGAVSCVSALASILSSAVASGIFSSVSDPDGSLYWPGLTFLCAFGLNVLAVAVTIGVDTQGLAHPDAAQPDPTVADTATWRENFAASAPSESDRSAGAYSTLDAELGP